MLLCNSESKSVTQKQKLSELWNTFSDVEKLKTEITSGPSIITFEYKKDFDENGIVYVSSTFWKTFWSEVDPAVIVSKLAYF